MKNFFCLLAIWFSGFCVLFLKYYSPLNLDLSIPNFLLVFWIAVPVLVILIKGYNEKLSLFFLLLFSVSLRLVPTLSDGASAFVVIRDPIYNLALSQTIMNTGRWVPYVGTSSSPLWDMIFTPAMNMLSAMFARVSGLDLYTACRFLPGVVFTIPITLLLFKIFKELSSYKIAILATFIFVLCYKFNTFDSLFVQESLGLVFFLIAIYALLMTKRINSSSKRAYSLVFILAAFSIAWTHFLTGLILLFVALIALGFSRAKTLFSAQFSINSVDFMVIAITFLSWVLFVASFFLHVTVGYGKYFLSQLPTIISGESKIVAVGASTGIILSPIESALAYSGILVMVLFGALGFFCLISKRTESPNYAVNWLRMFGVISFFLGVTFMIGLVGFKASDVAYRFITFFYIFISPLSAIGLSKITTSLTNNLFRMSNKRFSINRAVLTVILVVLILSTALLIPSFQGGSVRLADQDIVACSNWLSTYGNQTFVVVGETSLAEPIAAYANMTFGSENNVALGNQTITDVLYYGGNVSNLAIFLFNNPNLVFIINKHFVDYNEFLLRFDTQTTPPSVNSFNLTLTEIIQLTFLDKVYDGNSPSVYLNVEKESK